MKRLFLLFLLVALCVTAVPCVGMAEADRQSGEFFYKIKGNGTAIITGYDWDNHKNGEIYIPRMLDGYTVTEIGEKAFYCLDEDENGVPQFKSTNQRVKGVVIPDTVRSIGKQAFMGLSFEHLSLTIPASVEYIGYGAFSGLRGIKQFVVESNNPVYATIDGILYNKQRKELIAFPYSYDVKEKINYREVITVNIPNGIVSIADYAFWSVGNYFDGYSVTLPQSLQSIGDFAFARCIDLCMELPQSLRSIGDFAFANCRDLDLHPEENEIFKLPSSLAQIGIGTFYKCGFVSEGNLPFNFTKTLDLSNTQLTEIPDYAFYDLYRENTTQWEDFSKLVFPETLISIGVEAFKNLEFEYPGNSIVFPASLKYIGNRAFEHVRFNSDSDKGFTFPTNAALISIGDAAFRDSDCNHVILSSRLESIGSYAFENCRNLKKLSIPADVTVIGEDICSKSFTVVEVIPGTYAALWASENGYTTQQAGTEDTSWLNGEDTSWLND